MKEQEKAEQLLNKYLTLLYGKKPFYKKSDYFKAKKVALVCVKEIMELNLLASDNWYWQGIEKRIEQMPV